MASTVVFIAVRYGQNQQGSKSMGIHVWWTQLGILGLPGQILNFPNSSVFLCLKWEHFLRQGSK